MQILLMLLLVAGAGIINGSFALPTKYMAKWREENIWLAFSFCGFLILPWLSMWLLDHQVITAFFALPTQVLVIMALGGFLFGLGQVCFAFALRILGLGLAFVINIGLGTAGSALLPIFFWHQDKICTPYGYSIFGGVMLFIAGVLLATVANKQRELYRKIDKPVTSGQKYSFTGIILGILASIGSICQALTYIYLNPVVVAHTQKLMPAMHQLALCNLTWLGIFSTAFIPYVIYFAYLNCRDKSFHCYQAFGSNGYWPIIAVMGLFYWISVVLFSKASQVLGSDLAPVIAWPVFMIFIILTSNFWGLMAKEWQGCGKIAGTLMAASVAILTIAVAVFAYANSLS